MAARGYTRKKSPKGDVAQLTSLFRQGGIMKRIRRLLIFCLCVGVFAALFAFAACSGIPKLSAPQNLSVENDTLLLSWDEVSDATGYLVDISGQQKSTAKTEYSLDILSEGEYTIKVKALGDGETFQDSAWSDTIRFTRETESQLTFTAINDDTAYEVTGIGKASGDIVIPDYYREKPVVSIGVSAFSNKSTITGITMGDNITSIGSRAFYNCTYLTFAEIGKNVESIGSYAFQSCRSLEKIVLPDTVTTIEEYTFSYCRSLTDVTFGKNITEIGASAFSNCDLLESIVIPDTVVSVGASAFSNCTNAGEILIGNGVTSISDYAFDSCSSASTIQINSSVTSIGSYSFRRCTSVESFDLSSDKLTSIGAFAFYGDTALANVVLGDNIIYIGGYAFYDTAIWSQAQQNDESLVYVGEWLVGYTGSANMSEILSIDSGTVGISAYALASCSAIESAVIPDQVKYVNEYAFYQCENLQYVTIGMSVIEIGEAAFFGCPYLGSVVFRSVGDLVSIGKYAFAAESETPNTRLSQITLPEGLETIGRYAFRYCSALKEVSIPDSVMFIGAYAFQYTYLWDNTQTDVIYVDNWVVGYAGELVTELDESTLMTYMLFGVNITCTIEEGTVGISEFAFMSALIGYCYIPDSVTKVGTGVFYDCELLRYAGAVDGSGLPSGITAVSNYMFYNCIYGLNTVNIPDHITEIGSYAFANCTNLYTVTLGSSVTTIKPYAFFLAPISSIEFNDSLKEIGSCAFTATSLSSVTIPDSVTTLGSFAFAYCTSLSTVHIGSGITSLENSLFAGCSSLTSITIPSNIRTIGAWAFYDCAILNTIVLEEGVETIGEHAFEHCYELKYIVLPESLKTIKQYAFFMCMELESIVLPSTLTDIEDYAFYACEILTIYCEAETAPEGWGERYNPLYRPTVWGCTISDEGYVVSFTKSESSLSYFNLSNTATNPVRSGYNFVGWSTSPNGEAEYVTQWLSNVSNGTVLYAVWEEAPVVTEDENSSI